MAIYLTNYTYEIHRKLTRGKIYTENNSIYRLIRKLLSFLFLAESSIHNIKSISKKIGYQMVLSENPENNNK